MRSWAGRVHRAPTAIAGCAAVVLCSGVVTALVLPAASVHTSVLRHPAKVTVTPAAGLPRAAHDGQVINAGDVVTVAPGGGAEITTGPRKLLMGGASQVRLDGPASTELRRGSIVALDAGRNWSLQVDQVTVTGITGAIRGDYGYGVRVADYSGRVSLRVSSGATAELFGLDQVDAAGSVLDGSRSPLRLADDALDVSAAPSLVQLDRGLNALARQVDADPYLLAAFGRGSDSPSETILPAAIGAAGQGGTARSRGQTAMAARVAHGSWGTIARAVDAGLPSIREQLATLLDSSPTQIASAQATAERPVATAKPSAQPGVSRPPANRLVPSSPAPAVSGAPPTGVGNPTPSAPAVNTSAPGRASPTVTRSVTTSSPTPSAAATPVLTLLLSTVGGLLPSPLPVTLGPVPSPSAVVSPGLIDGLVNTVGGLLGGSTGPGH